MTYEESKIVVKRMVDDAKKKAPPPNHIGHFAYITGALEEKIRFMLTTSNLKFKNFDEAGSLKFPI